MALNIRQPFHLRELTPLTRIVVNDITRNETGFCVLPPYMPGQHVDFCEMVVPELQKRGLFRTEYTGTTLREHLGLPRPQSRYRTRPAAQDQP